GYIDSLTRNKGRLRAPFLLKRSQRRFSEHITKSSKQVSGKPFLLVHEAQQNLKESRSRTICTSAARNDAATKLTEAIRPVKIDSDTGSATCHS
ncbi:hypothetical protein, partial [uncultured Salinisphaera sp.]|uniref:hypothetical protein n=1 Tax=uncultured Salinisphaera sp. TaxID=359372 RepID=UPI0032B0FFE6